MARKFIPIEDVEARVEILQIAQMLGLEIKPVGSQFRCQCPVHGGDHRSLCVSPQVRSRRGSLGVFFCQSEKTGGDRVGLVAHIMEIGQQDAIVFLAEQLGMEAASSATVTSATVDSSQAHSAPSPSKKASTSRETTRQPKSEQPFNPEAFFKEKLVYSEEVAALGFSEEDAEHFQVGFHRGKVYAPLRHPDGSIACFYDYANGTLKLPARARWLEQSAPNVIPFGKKSA